MILTKNRTGFGKSRTRAGKERIASLLREQGALVVTICAGALLTGCGSAVTGGAKPPRGAFSLRAGAANLGVQTSARPASAWLESGSVVLSRPAPQIVRTASISPNNVPNRSDSRSKSAMRGALGFMPTESRSWEVEATEPVVVLQRRTGALLVFEEGELTTKTKADGLGLLRPGKYRIMHKQKNPAWYAPDRYFKERGLSLPSEGAAERYRRGALGGFAVYIDRRAAIHSAPIWTEEVGGVRVDEAALRAAYEKLSVGAIVEVE